MAPKKQRTREEAALYLGVPEGAEIFTRTSEWESMTLQKGSVLEICVAGSSLSFGQEEWFAVLVTEMGASIRGGALISGKLLGTERQEFQEEIQRTLEEGRIHLCVQEPCGMAAEPGLLHATRVRCWCAQKPSRPNT